MQVSVSEGGPGHRGVLQGEEEEDGGVKQKEG